MQFSNENFLLQTYLTGIFQIHPLLDFLKICPSLKNSQKSKKIKNRQNSRCRLSISSPFEEKFHNISKICHSFQRHCKFSLQIQYFLFCCFFLLFILTFHSFQKAFTNFKQLVMDSQICKLSWDYFTFYWIFFAFLLFCWKPTLYL